MFRSVRTRLVAALVALALVGAAGTGGAESDVDRLGERLATGSDFRVRTQAALALGACRKKAAIRPLCRALGDPSASVRAASAAALGKLRLGGKSCLEQRLATEKSDSVKTVLKKALARLEEKDQPTISGATKYYVAVESSDKTGRKNSDVEQLFRDGTEKAVSALPEIALAPAKETTQAAKKVLGQHPKVRGFLLSAQVHKPSYTQDALSVRLDVAIFTYPEKNLKGTLPVKLTMQGVRGSDPAAENELIQNAARSVMEKFAKHAERIP